MGYFSIHNHSHYSNIRMLDSLIKPEQLVDCALTLGLTGVCLTDHEALGGHIKILEYVNKLKRECETREKEDNGCDERLARIKDFKLGLGNEIYLCRDGLMRETYKKDQDKYYHFLLVAKDNIGHHQLRLLSSRAWERSYYQFIERVPTYYNDLEEVITDKGHLIATTACLQGQFDKLLLDEKEDTALNFCRWARGLFGEDFYLEIQPGLSPEQIKFNKKAVEFSEKYNFKIVVSTDSHYLRPEDRPIHKAFLNAGEGDREVDEFYQFAYVMTEEEIRENLKYLSEETINQIFSNLNEIKEKIGSYNLFNPQKIPRVPLPEINPNSELKTTPFISKFLTSPHNEDRYFITKCIEKLKELKLDDKVHWNRLEEECEEIWIVSEKIKECLSAYFIVIAKVIDLAWTSGDSLVGAWRGSIGSLLTAYLLDIIQDDPLNSPIPLPYWRCVSRGRAELADIDCDFQASKREQIVAAISSFFKSIGGETTVVATYITETSKAALNTAARGLGYESEFGSSLAALIPIDRGAVRTLHQCYYGDEEKGYEVSTQFVKEMNLHPDIWEVAQGIEGLISRRGTHAAGIILTNEPFTNCSSTMKSPKGLKCSQWDLEDEEKVGHIKFDCLTTDALDRIRICMELLSEYGYIEWQSSLKETYLKYLAPSRTEKTDKDMWLLASENKISSLFQFDTPVGLQCVRKIKPENLLMLSQANSLMRLMPEKGKEAPVDIFVRYKENPDLLVHDIYSLDAADYEKEILYNFIKVYNGVLDSQESVMLAVMIPEFTNYSIDEANKLRKIIAKKHFNEITQAKTNYFTRGEELGTSFDILSYIWNQISFSMGYSFSSIHTLAYSHIAIQELNLAYYYPSIFWNTACLIVDSGGIEKDEPERILVEDDFVIEEDESDEDDEVVMAKEVVKKAPNKIDYGAISSAIGKMREAGIVVLPPDINKNKFTFTPDLETNSILYGIKGITQIGQDLAKEILDKRPYSSLVDFLNRVKIKKPQVVNLIKAGAFDNLEGANRGAILQSYINSIAGTKTKLTLQNLNKLIEEDLIPEEYNFEKALFNFNKYIRKTKVDDILYLDSFAREFYLKYFDEALLTYIDNEKAEIPLKAWEKIYKSKIERIRPFINNPTTLESLNRRLIRVLWDKYCLGTVSRWEMDSLGFYYHSHELEGISLSSYGIEDFFNLPEEPIVEKSFTTKEGTIVNMFRLSRIAGTIIDKDKLKNTITLLTTSGVVKVKIFKPQFVKYDKQLFEKNEETGKKKVIEKSWFTRGNKIIITGLRREDTFIPKVYKNTPYRPIELITDINYATNNLALKSERIEV